MTSGNLDEIGFRAVGKDVPQYEALGRRVTATNAAMVKSQLDFARTGLANERTIRQANARIGEAQANLAEVVRKQNLKQAASHQQVEKARKSVAAAATQDAAKQIAAQKTLDAAILKADDVRITRIAAISKAERQLASARIGAAELASIAALNLQKSEAGVVQAGGRVARNQNLATRALGGFQVATRAAAGSLNFLGRGLIAITGFSNRFAVAVRFGIAALTAFTAAMVIGAAAKFESQLAKIDNLTETSTEKTAELGKEILNLSRTIPRSPDELGAGLYQILSSGVNDADEALELLSISAKASAIGMGDTKDIARTLTGIINSYGKENITAAQAADILTAAVKRGSGEASDFANSLGRVLGLGATVGVEFDDVAASLATLTNRSLDASKAETALLGIFNQILSPSDRAKEILIEYQTSIEEVRRVLAEDGVLAMLKFLDVALKGNIQAFERIFPDVRGLGGALLLMGREGTDAAADLLAVQNSVGILDTAFERASHTFEFQANLLKNQLSIALINIGSYVLPLVTAKLKELLKWVDENQEEIKAFAADLINFATSAISGFVKGLLVINSALSWIPNNKGMIVAAIVLIGATMVAAFGPGSAAIIGLLSIVTLLGQVAGMSSATTGDRGKQIARAAIGIGLPVAGGVAGAFAGGPAGALGGIALGGIAAQGVNAALFPGGKGKDGKNLSAAEQAQEAALQSLKKIQEDYTKQTLKDTESGFDDLALASDEAAGSVLTLKDAISDGIIDFEEASKLNMDAVTAGAYEAAAAIDDAAKEAFDFTKTLSKLANTFERNRIAGQKLVSSMIRTALELTNAAASAIFGRPTQEVAALELEMAKVNRQRLQLQQTIDPQIQALQDQLDALEDVTEDAAAQASRQTNVTGNIFQTLDASAEEEGKKGKSAADIQRKAIEDQIEALENLKKPLDRQAEALEIQIQLYEAESEILQKQIQLADETLLTQAEQANKAKELIESTAFLSKAQRELSAQIGEDIVPEMDEMRKAVEQVRLALEILNDPTLRSTFLRAIEDVSEAASGAAGGLRDHASATADATKTIREATEELAESMATNIKKFKEIGGFTGPGDIVPKLPEGITPRVPGPEGHPGALGPTPGLQERLDEELRKRIEEIKLYNTFQTRAHGGLVTRPEIAVLHPPELILPLNDQTRSRELLRSIPASISSASRDSGPVSLFRDMNIQGETLDTMQAMAIRETKRGFREAARQSSLRRRGL